MIISIHTMIYCFISHNNIATIITAAIWSPHSSIDSNIPLPLVHMWTLTYYNL